jgi:hypothetical protein
MRVETAKRMEETLSVAASEGCEGCEGFEGFEGR